MRNFFLMVCMAWTYNCFAQLPHKFEVGAGLGGTVYQGETQLINFSEPLYEIKPGLSLLFNRAVSNNLSVRMGLLLTSISGKDLHYTDQAWRQERGLSFESPLVELSAIAEIYPFGVYKAGKKGLSKHRRLLTPFLGIGLGATYAHPDVFWNDATPNEYLDPQLAAIDKKYNKKTNISLPMGLGCRIRISDQFTLGAECLARPTLNDYLDGISVAGNPGRNDWFANAQILAHYTFGKASKHKKGGRQPAPDEDKIPMADTDGDNVPDERDDCPDVPGLRSFKGCPDSDRDGIADRNDDCPEAAGLPSLNGCPDRDEDGITDAADNCPDIKGVAAYRGCPPVDRDKDGVADAEDLCPDMNGLLRWKGCPDTDNDGLPDNKDGCPGIPGPDDLGGCPDADEDGVVDKDDECPTIYGLKEKKGCPEALPPAPGVPYKALYFNSTLQDWQEASKTTLQEIVAIMLADPALNARVEGHTDNTGQEPANDLLAEKRAKRCYDSLITSGIAANRLSFVGFGSKKPIVPNDTRQNRQLNRRVEVHFYKKG